MRMKQFIESEYCEAVSKYDNITNKLRIDESDSLVELSLSELYTFVRIITIYFAESKNTGEEILIFNQKRSEPTLTLCMHYRFSCGRVTRNCSKLPL